MTVFTSSAYLFFGREVSSLSSALFVQPDHDLLSLFLFLHFGKVG